MNVNGLIKFVKQMDVVGLGGINSHLQLYQISQTRPSIVFRSSLLNMLLLGVHLIIYMLVNKYFNCLGHKILLTMAAFITEKKLTVGVMGMYGYLII